MHWTRIAGLSALLALTFGCASGRASTPSLIVFSADRAPSVSGEVYRLDPNGHRVDLTKSPYPDLFPVVSPNGKKVALVRDLGAAGSHVFEVGINGKGLVRVGPTLSRLSERGCDPGLAWQPGGNRLAITWCGSKSGLWIVQPGRKPRVAAAAGTLQPSWSPDGRVLAATSSSPHPGAMVVHAFSPTGRPLWHVPGLWFGSWSAKNLLAVPSKTGVAVYDETGHLLSKTAGQVTGGPAWSPNGQLLAVIAGGWLVVRTPSGEGVLVHQRLGTFPHALAWDGNDRVVVGGYGSCACQAKSVDVNTGKSSPASSRWFAPLSANRKLAALTPKSGSGYAIQVAPPAGGAGTTYSHIPAGYDDGPVAPVQALQFAGLTRSLVYASYNPEPFSNLYSVAPTGGTPRQLAVKPYATSPSLSPDGSKIAYVWAPYTGMTCKGCASQIRVANADGSGTHILTTPQDCTFDSSPTWSPDGNTIVFSEDACDSPGELFTVPSGGGSRHDLRLAGINPAWGPAKIAYEGTGGIWTANPDGSNPTKVGAGHDPAWSSTGMLAYLTGSSGVTVGQSHVNLPFASVASLAWSPDGTHLVVTARKTKNSIPDVYTVKTDGTDPVRLTTNYDASGASWG